MSDNGSDKERDEMHRREITLPDGRYMVHAIEDAGKQSLWVRQVATGSDVQIVTPGSPFAGIAITPDGNYVYYTRRERDINLYFDKDKHRLVKAECQAIDPITKKEVNREEFYSGHKAVDGIMTPRRLIVHHDGALFMEVELSDVRYRERHEAGVFAKP